MIARRTVLMLGLSQLLCWGVSYYLIGVLGEGIARDLGWSRERVYGGFSLALLVMGLVSAPVGRMIDRHGGQPVMATGSCLIGLACLWLAWVENFGAWLAAWALMGLGMRCTLYDAAFATLARIGGAGSGRAMAQITLLGGLASTALWPAGHALAAEFGWRGALMAYAAIAMATLPLHLALPVGRAAERTDRAPPAPPLAEAARERMVAGGLFALCVTLTSFLNSGMSSHMIGMLTGVGLTASLAVWASALRGVGQSLARLTEVLFGARLHPLTLNVSAAAALPLCFGVSFLSAVAAPAALAFAFLYGAGNGLLTISRGTVPLTLFDPKTYGAFVGRLLGPGWIVSAAAPLIYAAVIERYGSAGGMWLSMASALLLLAAATALWLRYRPRPA